MPRAWVTSEAYNALVEVLVQARASAGLSQRDLAERVEKPRSYISKIETKERRIDAIELIDLAEALGIEPRRLFDEVVVAVRQMKSR
jgi:transcriptional regulator with XRE-family HTH domain